VFLNTRTNASWRNFGPAWHLFKIHFAGIGCQRVFCGGFSRAYYVHPIVFTPGATIRHTVMQELR